MTSLCRLLKLGLFSGLWLVACDRPELPEPPDKNEPTETEPPPGQEGGACYGNDTCDAPLICENDVCISEPTPDLTGQVGGPCYANDTCNEGLVCEESICVEKEDDPPPPDGSLGGPCYGNGSCDEPLVCEEDTCVEVPPPETGTLGGACYGNGTCNAGLICENEVCVTAPERGDNGQPCLPGDNCNGNHVCVEELCVPAGDEDQPCLDDNTCTTPYECIDNVCVSTGGDGEPCSVEDSCNTGYVCVAELCVAAGGNGEPCLPDEVCDEGYLCYNAQCVPAGGNGQPCDADGSCDQGYVCIDEDCISAGGSDQPCLADGTCDVGYNCLGNICQSTGGENEPCNPDGSCDSGLSCGLGDVCLAIVEPDCSAVPYGNEDIDCDTLLGTAQGYCAFMFPPPVVQRYEGPSCSESDVCENNEFNVYFQCIDGTCVASCPGEITCPNGYACEAGICEKTVNTPPDFALLDTCAICNNTYYNQPNDLENCVIEGPECTPETATDDCGEGFICENNACTIYLVECTEANQDTTCGASYQCIDNACVLDDVEPPPPPPQSNCMQCHAPAGYDGLHSIEDPHPWVTLDCVACHGMGDPHSFSPIFAHVCAPPEVGGSGQGPQSERAFQTLDPRAHFLRTRLVGVDLLADYTCDNLNGTQRNVTPLEWLAFINPGNLRVAQAVMDGDMAPVGCAACHSGEAKKVIRSVMGQASGINSGTRHGVGIDNYYPDRRGNFSDGSTDFNTIADYGASDVTNDDFDASDRKVGEVPSLKRAQVFTGLSFKYDPSFTADQVNNSLNQNANELDNYPNGLIGNVAGQLFQEVINQACTGCHLQSNYQNFRSGDYRTQGCSQCHFSTAVTGRSSSSDPNVNKTEPLNPDALVPGEHGHRRDHRIRNVAKPPNLAAGQYQAVQGIDDFRCITCHSGSNRTVAQYYGYRLDENQDLTNGDFYPSGNTVTFTTRNALFGNENATFNGRVLDQWIDEEIWQANGGQDETPPDVHHEAGMGCIDCHGLGATHGSGRIYSRMKLQTHENDVLCQTCHGDIDGYAATDDEGQHIVDQNGVPLNNTLVTPQNNFYLISKLNGAYHYIPQVKDIVDVSTTNNKVNPDTQLPLKNLVASYAMGRYQEGDNLLQDGYGPIQADTTQLPSTYAHQDGYVVGQGESKPGQGLECYTCHAAWQNNCIGCHLDAEYDANATNFFYSNVTGERIYFNFDASFVYQNPINFMMGINDRGKISPYQGLHRFFSYTDLNGDTSDRVSYGDRNGLGNDPALGYGQRNNHPALQNQPFTPHTMRGRWTQTQVGMRGCLDCHLPNEDAVQLVNHLGETYNLRDIDGNGTDLLADYDDAITLNVSMAWGLGSDLWHFDENGDPVYDNNNNTAYDLDRLVEETGVSNTSSNHPLLDTAQINDDYLQTQDTNNAKVVRPLTYTVLERIRNVRLDTIYYYSIDPTNDIQYWLRNYNYDTQ